MRLVEIAITDDVVEHHRQAQRADFDRHGAGIDQREAQASTPPSLTQRRSTRSGMVAPRVACHRGHRGGDVGSGEYVRPPGSAAICWRAWAEEKSCHSPPAALRRTWMSPMWT
jgi:hypothetical protein